MFRIIGCGNFSDFMCDQSGKQTNAEFQQKCLWSINDINRIRYIFFLSLLKKFNFLANRSDAECNADREWRI